jgi:hypothetical protein
MGLGLHGPHPPPTKGRRSLVDSSLNLVWGGGGVGVCVELRLPPQVCSGQGLTATSYIKRGKGNAKALQDLGTPSHPSPASAPDRRLLLTAIRRYCRIIVVDVISLSLSLRRMERCSISTTYFIGVEEGYRIFTDIFCIVWVIDHTFDRATPNSYVWIPSEVLHMRH